MVSAKAPARPYRRLFKRLDGALREAHEHGKLKYVGGLSDLRDQLAQLRLSSSHLEDVKKALHIASFRSQQFLKDLQPDERLSFDKSVADFQRRFGHIPANYEVQNESRAWFNLQNHTPVRVKNHCVAVSAAMAVLLYSLIGSKARIGFTAMPGHVSTTLRLNGIVHVVHAFGVQPLTGFKAALAAAARDERHPLRKLAENGGLHRIRPVEAYLDGYMPFAEGHAAARLRRVSALLNRAFAHAQSGNLDDAERFAREARRLSPGSFRPLALLSRIFYHQNRLDLSVQAAREAIRLNPLTPEAHHQLGVTLRAQKNYAESIRAFDASLVIRPDAPSTVEAQQDAWARWSRESGLVKGLAVDAARGWHAFKRRWSPVFQRA